MGLVIKLKPGAGGYRWKRGGGRRVGGGSGCRKNSRPDGGADNMEMLIIYPLPRFDLPSGTSGSAPRHIFTGALPARIGGLFFFSFFFSTLFVCVCRQP